MLSIRTLDDWGQTIAFTLADFIFKKELASVPITQILDAATDQAAYSLVMASTICWTVQKYDGNGQKIDYQYHQANVDFCPVFMMICIVCRFDHATSPSPSLCMQIFLANFAM